MANIFDPRSKVLLTGFGPFPGVARNESSSLVKWLARRARSAIPSYRFVAAVLPTEWVLAPQVLAELYDRHDPVLALHFGVATIKHGFRIETEARNFRRASPDATGCLPATSKVTEDGVEVRTVTIDAPSIATDLSAKGYAVSLSDDAGGYLCNAVLFHSLILAEGRGGGCPVGFVHIPTVVWPPALITTGVAGALDIIKFTLEPEASNAALTSV
jgi:pyroglutamyl-peptidase